jgi:hypothetical protein
MDGMKKTFNEWLYPNGFNRKEMVDDLGKQYTIKKLFVQGYFNPNFLPIFVPTVQNIITTNTKGIVSVTYNDLEKMFEVIYDESKMSVRYANEYRMTYRMKEAMCIFVNYCYEDKTMRDILYSIDNYDFNIFDQYMKDIYEKSNDIYVQKSRVFELVNLLYNVLELNDNLIRILLV